MTTAFRQILESSSVSASAPCRVDLGGTLDISSLYYPLAHLHPCTFNAALDLRTRVRITPYEPRRIRVSSRGFAPAEFFSDEAPFDHCLGLMFAVAACFHISGIHIEIDSASPPRSALGGSSVAAVALVAAFSCLEKKAQKPGLNRSAMAVLAHGIEQGIAGVPCGMQDQLAAAYGGVNAWHWKQEQGRLGWQQQVLAAPENAARLSANLLVAYCGEPHESKDINGTWIRRFIQGRDRLHWEQIVDASRQFVQAFARGDMESAAAAMNRETELRRQITPEVVDGVGGQLLAVAATNNCGARFTGAGGGGCIWALGPEKAVSELRGKWSAIVAGHPDGAILDARIDTRGVCQGSDDD